MIDPKTLGLASLAALTGAAAARAADAPAPTSPASATPAADADPDEVANEVGARMRAGDETRAALLATRVVESVGVVFDERTDAGRVRVLVDGIAVARRHFADLDETPIEIGRRGREVVVRVDDGEATVARLVVRYVPLPTRTIREPRLTDPASVEWTSATTRVAKVGRAFVSGDRLRLPAEGTGRRIREVRVRATALDFRSRLKLQGGGLEPSTVTVARDDTAVFDTRRVPDDTEDLVLVVDLRRVRIDDVTIVYDPPRACEPAAPAGEPGRGRPDARAR